MLGNSVIENQSVQRGFAEVLTPALVQFEEAQHNYRENVTMLLCELERHDSKDALDGLSAEILVIESAEKNLLLAWADATKEVNGSLREDIERGDVTLTEKTLAFIKNLADF